jgi:hypothetical protein
MWVMEVPPVVTDVVSVSVVVDPVVVLPHAVIVTTMTLVLNARFAARSATPPSSAGIEWMSHSKMNTLHRPWCLQARTRSTPRTTS